MTVRDFSPAALKEAQRLYEQTDASPDSIARLLGIGRRTLYTRIKIWGWRPRVRYVPGAARLHDHMQAGDSNVPREKLIARLVARVETEISAVERLIARAGWQSDAATADTERAARTLSILVRSLRELAALEKNQTGEDDDAAERDADAYRRELEATLERVLAGGAAA